MASGIRYHIVEPSIHIDDDVVVEWRDLGRESTALEVPLSADDE